MKWQTPREHVSFLEKADMSWLLSSASPPARHNTVIDPSVLIFNTPASSNRCMASAILLLYSLLRRDDRRCVWRHTFNTAWGSRCPSFVKNPDGSVASSGRYQENFEQTTPGQDKAYVVYALSVRHSWVQLGTNKSLSGEWRHLMSACHPFRTWRRPDP